MEHTIDATGKSVGRVATEAATVLMGKHSPTFERHQAAGTSVHITNAAQAAISPKKRAEKMYKSFSGYPGGLKEQTMEKVIEKKGVAEVFRKAVYGMLPSNRLRNGMMKKLKISE